MSPTISPAGTSKLTSCTALRPLKLFDTPLMWSNAPMLALGKLLAASVLELQPSCQRRPHPIGQKHHHNQQTKAVEHLLDAGDIDAEHPHQLAQTFRQCRQQKGADDGPEQRTDAADDR